MFGCGKAAYAGTLDDDNVPADAAFEQPQNGVTITTLPAQRQAPPSVTTAPPMVQQARPAAPVRNRLTSKQLAAIWGIGRKRRRSRSALAAGTFNVALGLAVGERLPTEAHVVAALIKGALGYGISIVLHLLAVRSLGAAPASGLLRDGAVRRRPGRRPAPP
jgi:hypothetical protein